MLDYNSLYEYEDSLTSSKVHRDKPKVYSNESTKFKQVRVRNQTRFIKDNDENNN